MANNESDETMSTISIQSSHIDAQSYYSSVQEQGLAKRNESPILYSRNFTNWTKSMLIQEYVKRIELENRGRQTNLRVFDMGCGKGGDIPKWTKSNVKSVVFADVAENLVELCEARFNERRCRFKPEFCTLDCTTELLRDKLKDRDTQFDLVSSQLVLHYSFESFEKANRFLRNAAESLRIGGYFIGTTVNACRVVKLCRDAPDQSISNDVFSIRFDESIDLKCQNGKPIPLFGAKYHFKLVDVVDCPEYLVYFPLLIELAKRHGLEFVDSKAFNEYFDENWNNDDARFMLKKIDALQRCPVPESNDSTRNNPQHRTCRSISKSEWEVTSLYITFAFRKHRTVTYDNNDNELA